MVFLGRQCFGLIVEDPKRKMNVAHSLSNVETITCYCFRFRFRFRLFSLEDDGSGKCFKPESLILIISSFFNFSKNLVENFDDAP